MFSAWNISHRGLQTEFEGNVKEVDIITGSQIDLLIFLKNPTEVQIRNEGYC